MVVPHGCFELNAFWNMLFLLCGYCCLFTGNIKSERWTTRVDPANGKSQPSNRTRLEGEVQVSPSLYPSNLGGARLERLVPSEKWFLWTFYAAIPFQRLSTCRRTTGNVLYPLHSCLCHDRFSLSGSQHTVTSVLSSRVFQLRSTSPNQYKKRLAISHLR